MDTDGRRRRTAIALALVVPLLAGCGIIRFEPCDQPQDHICDEEIMDGWRFPWLG